jgi:hypothetical protein
MRRALKIALAGAAIALGTAATPAAAVTLQQCTSGASCVSGTTNVNLGTYDAPGSLLVSGTVGVGGPTVNFTSDNGLLETNTGAATIFTASGDLLSQLTFTLLTGSFTAAEFNLENGNIKAMDVVLSTNTGATKVISLTNANGSNIFDIIADPGESFTGASFVATAPNGFVDFKQLRLVLGTGTAPVPEPATWGMMLLGFAGIGMAMRRRRSGRTLMQIA